MSNLGFTIDIGEKYLKIADVEKNKDKFSIKALSYTKNPFNLYTSGQIKEEQEIASLLEKLIKDAGIKKKNVNLIIPDSFSYSQILEMPLLTEKELISAVKYQADQFIPLPIEKINLDLEILVEDKKNKKIKILIVAAENSIIDKVTNVAERAGLIPQSIENETSANLRFFSEILFPKIKKDGETKSILFINISNQSSSLYLYDFSTNLPLEIHNFSLGFNIFTKEIQENFNLNENQAVEILEKFGFSQEETPYNNLPEVLSAPIKEYFLEIDRFLISSKTKFNVSVNEIYLLGEGFNINSLDKKLSSLLGIKVNLIDISSFFAEEKIINSFKNNLPLFVCSIGGELR